jgi:outer membrane protein
MQFAFDTQEGILMMQHVWKSAALAVAMAGVLAAGTARAEDESPWMVRLRAVYLSPANKSDANNSLEIPANAVHINSKWLPDIDAEYFFAPHWSTELVLTYPQKQTVTLGGTDIGTFKHLPPVLTAKYNFNPSGLFRPYVGLGVNLTLFSNENIAVGGNPLTLSSSSFGPAAQAGFDYKLAEHWFLNADVKWVQLRTDVKLNGAKILEARVDPLLYGIGIGYRFGRAAAPVAAPVRPAPVAPPAPPAPPAPAPVVAPPPVAPAPAPVAPPAPPAQEVVLKGVNFETASNKLKPESIAVLDSAVANIRKCNCGKVEIRGYTDSVGKAEYNQKLSERRAIAVKDYLVAHGIPADMLTAQGFGEENPIASNDTAAGRAENRRVTVQFKGIVSR